MRREYSRNYFQLTAVNDSNCYCEQKKYPIKKQNLHWFTQHITTIYLAHFDYSNFKQSGSKDRSGGNFIVTSSRLLVVCGCNRVDWFPMLISLYCLSVAPSFVVVFDAFESGAELLCSCNHQSSGHRLWGHGESVQKRVNLKCLFSCTSSFFAKCISSKDYDSWVTVKVYKKSTNPI